MEDAGAPPPAGIEVEKDFILTLETLPILWDKTHKNYINKYKRNEALEKLLIILKKIKPNSSIEDVKKKIISLRTNYRRDLKKILVSQRSGAGADEVYSPKSWSFEYLSFLNKFEQPVNRSIDTEDNICDESQQQERGTESEYGRTLSSVAEIPPPTPPPRVKKSFLAKQNELLDRACAYLVSEPKQTDIGNSIAFDWAGTLNRLHPTQRLFAKKAINDILFEAELGNLTRNSVQINIPDKFSTTTFSSHDVCDSIPSFHTTSPIHIVETSGLPPTSEYISSSSHQSYTSVISTGAQASNDLHTSSSIYLPTDTSVIKHSSHSSLTQSHPSPYSETVIQRGPVSQITNKTDQPVTTLSQPSNTIVYELYVPVSESEKYSTASLFSQFKE